MYLDGGEEEDENDEDQSASANTIETQNENQQNEVINGKKALAILCFKIFLFISSSAL